MPEVVRKDGSTGYVYEPFQRGNTAHLTHGARSERIVAEKAAAVRAKLLDHFPYLADDVFAEAVERYCRAESRAVLLHDYVMAKAEQEGVEAVPRSLWQEASRAESNAQKFASDCGLDARGHAAIARDLGVATSVVRRDADLATFAAEGRKLRQLRSRGA